MTAWIPAGIAVLLAVAVPLQAGPPPPRAVGPAPGAATVASLAAGGTRLWVGLQDDGDEGTRFDVRAELYVNDERVAEGEARCVADLSRSPRNAREVTVSLGPLTNGDIVAGDVVALKVLTRIGTNSNGTRCGGPRNAVGLRLHYDAVGRPSHLGAPITPETTTGYFLRSTGEGLTLDPTSPTRRASRKADSGPVSFNRGNPWVEVGNWSRKVTVRPQIYSGRGPGGPIADGVGAEQAGAPLRSTVTVPRNLAGPISDVWVEFEGFAHGWVGDLRARLIHPDGATSMDLFSRPGRGAGNFIDSSLYGFPSDFVGANTYAFSDNGTILFLSHPFGGPPGGWQQGPLIPGGIYRPSSNPNPPELRDEEYDYRPRSFAATFGGMRAGGDWTLEITDWGAEETGSLAGWTLHLCSGGCPAAETSLGDELFKLTAFDAHIGWAFGHSIALSGDTAIVGSPSYSGDGEFLSGSAYLFDVTTGRQLALLPHTGLAAGPTRFGSSVAIDGNTALVGALYDRVDVVGTGFATGSVYVFDVSDPSHPVERPKLFPSDATGEFTWEFGNSVAISGDLAVVGAPGGGGFGWTTGTAYLFDARTGQELAKLTASDAALGDGFGATVAISGHTVVVGTPYKESDTGAAYVFDVSDPRHPVERFKLTAAEAIAGPRFGESLAISGNRALLGASWGRDGDSSAGVAYLFDVTTGEQVGQLTPSLPEPDSNFGWSVALDGDTALVGAPFTDGPMGLSSGSAYMFDVSDPLHPAEILRLEASDAEDADWYGWAVALGGDTALVGATQVFTSAGKAFVYRGPSMP